MLPCSIEQLWAQSRHVPEAKQREYAAIEWHLELREWLSWLKPQETASNTASKPAPAPGVASSILLPSSWGLATYPEFRK